MTAVDDLVRKTRERIAALRRLPEATYRLQFHAGFTFHDAVRITRYLRDLGVTHAYASPYLKAQTGSTHGYDIVDHGCLNPEIGTEQDHRAWVDALRAHGLSHIVDMVPNHMGVASNDNAWWNDVLESGPASRFAGHFDIAWHASPRPELQNKVLLPFLGEPYGDVLEKGELRLSFAAGAFAIGYHARRFPLAVETYATVLELRLEELERTLGPESPPLAEYRSILTAVRNLPDLTQNDPVKLAEGQREKEVIKRRLLHLAGECQAVRDFIRQNVAQFNGVPGNPRSFDLLDKLLEHQRYRLAYWRVASDEINYRRFFDVNDLAALSMEREDVFAATHELVLRHAAEGKVGGLRIDHPDGLYDPRRYFQRVQEHFQWMCARCLCEAEGLEWNELKEALIERLRTDVVDAPGRSHPPLYIVAEKILSGDESLPDSWAVHGTSGYDFVSMTNGLFVDPAGEPAFRRLYHEWIEDDTRFHEVVYAKKILILQASLASELHMLAHQLDRLAQKSRRSRDFTLNTLRRALREVVACFPVYRSYIDENGAGEMDRRQVDTAIRRATARNPLLSRRVFRFIRGMLVLEYPDSFTEEDRLEQLRFAGKFQQVTAPVTAKGVEDTAFYVYNRLVALNEVGGTPERFGVRPQALHRYYGDRQAKWPFALSPLSTHDTKRSEDVRARLNVLSEMPDEWAAAVRRWSRLNANHRRPVEDDLAPDNNEEYLLYQTLVGAWPLEPYSRTEYEAFVQRIKAYMEKALHEAKVHTSWINPNTDYDQGVADFVVRILDTNNQAFLDDFRGFQRRVSHYGLYNSLAQTLLRLTAPGVPDTYQGTELWDFSLVDPDNRRPVDYSERQRLLAELQSAADSRDLGDLTRQLIKKKEDGRLKLYVTYNTLHCRRDNPGLFSEGDYLPLDSLGQRAEHLFAFARRQRDRWALVAVPRLLFRLAPDLDVRTLQAQSWEDTRVTLPAMGQDIRWKNVFTGETRSTGTQRSLLASDLLAGFPVALLIGTAG